MSLEDQLLDLLAGADDETVAALVDGLPDPAVEALAAALTKTGDRALPPTPADQAVELDPRYRVMPHLKYLSDRLTQAVRDVEAGRNRRMVISMPPRHGKSTLLAVYSMLWMLRTHPEWKIVLASHDPDLSGSWAKQIRDLIEEHRDLGVHIAPDGGAGGRWATVEGGGVFSTSVRGTLTGRGASVLLVDDPVKDFVEAHSATSRQALWDWWLTVAQPRLEPPFLALAVMTRWHETDLIGRMLSTEFEGDPADWEQVTLAAVAEHGDVLGRAVGDPLFSPLLEETRGEALERWAGVRRDVGSYVFASMYQQRPGPAKGAIFDVGWWRYWTTDPSKATDDGRVVYLDPAVLAQGRWLDSWDCAFKSTATSDFVVGQRWVRVAANRYLIAQIRDRLSFTQTIARMEQWARTDDPAASPFGWLVHQRLIEEKANGAAAIDVLRDKISGLKPINPDRSKAVRARAVTPEVESGNVFLPLPSDPGNGWVQDFLSEVRDFKGVAGERDDQVDALTQALAGLRDSGRGGITVPGRSAGGARRVSRDVAAAAASDRGRRGPVGGVRRVG